MEMEIVTIPCLSDNYAYLLHDGATGATAVIDVPDAAPIEAELERRGWRLTEILITHHHDDHIADVDALRQATGAKVIGAKADAHRLPALDKAVAEDDVVQVGNLEGRVIDVSGHTIGHIAVFFPAANAVFTADSLMALGCGRLFEGSADQMWESLCKLADLPSGTNIYSGHEYTESNARFALSIEPDNRELISRAERVAKARAENEPTVPATLAEELTTNPFLRARLPEVKHLIGRDDATDAEAFAEIRRRKDQF